MSPHQRESTAKGEAAEKARFSLPQIPHTRF